MGQYRKVAMHQHLEKCNQEQRQYCLKQSRFEVAPQNATALDSPHRSLRIGSRCSMVSELKLHVLSGKYHRCLRLVAGMALSRDNSRLPPTTRMTVIYILDHWDQLINIGRHESYLFR